MASTATNIHIPICHGSSCSIGIYLFAPYLRTGVGIRVRILAFEVGGDLLHVASRHVRRDTGLESADHAEKVR